MPLIEIQVLPATRVDRATVSRALNAAVADAIPCRSDAVWSTWRTIDGPFARGDEVSSDATGAVFGPVVHVYHHRTPEQVARAVEAIETVLARELSLRPDQVFVTTQPVAADDPTVTHREG